MPVETNYSRPIANLVSVSSLLSASTSRLDSASSAWICFSWRSCQAHLVLAALSCLSSVSTCFCRLVSDSTWVVVNLLKSSWRVDNLFVGVDATDDAAAAAVDALEGDEAEPSLLSTTSSCDLINGDVCTESPDPDSWLSPAGCRRSMLAVLGLSCRRALRLAWYCGSLTISDHLLLLFACVDDLPADFAMLIGVTGRPGASLGGVVGVVGLPAAKVVNFALLTSDGEVNALPMLLLLPPKVAEAAA